VETALRFGICDVMPNLIFAFHFRFLFFSSTLHRGHSGKFPVIYYRTFRIVQRLNLSLIFFFSNTVRLRSDTQPIKTKTVILLSFHIVATPLTSSFTDFAFGHLRLPTRSYDSRPHGLRTRGWDSHRFQKGGGYTKSGRRPGPGYTKDA
jgi:hypothetical protein